MNDLDRFKELLNSVSQPYSLYVGEEIARHDTGAVEMNVVSDTPVQTVIQIKTDKHAKTVGYNRFYTSFFFDAEGAYLGTGSFE